MRRGGFLPQDGGKRPTRGDFRLITGKQKTTNTIRRFRKEKCLERGSWRERRDMSQMGTVGLRAPVTPMGKKAAL